jgi:hypothetical protein
MPEALNITDVTWSGFAAAELRTRAVVDVDTVNKGAVTVKSGIRKSLTLPRVEITNFMQDRQANPTSQGTVTIDGVVLTPKDAMLYLELNPRDFEDHFYAENLPDRLIDRTLPPNGEEGIMRIVIQRLNEFFENAYWRGRLEYNPNSGGVDPTTKGEVAGASDYKYFDGFLKKLLNDSNTVKVGSPVALDSTNVYTKFTAAYNLVPHALMQKYGPLGLKTFAGYDTQRIYEDALTTAQFKNNDYTSKGINQYKGYELTALAGIPKDTFVMGIGNPETIYSNFYIGVNSTADNTLKFAQTLPASELWFIKGLFKIDTAVLFTDQAVLYTPITN